MRDRVVFTFIGTDQYRFEGYVADDGRQVPEGQYHLYPRDEAMYQLPPSPEDPQPVFDQAHIDDLATFTADLENRKTRIQEELQALVGQNILALTDAQRWKLVAAMSYRLGVINSNGVIQPFSDWVESSN